MATIETIADLILISSEVSLSHKELQKLLYFAQGFYLARNNEPLFPESLQAWEFGPVSPRIWGKFKMYGYHSINRPNAADVQAVPENVKAFILSLVLVFAPLGQSKLIEYTHLDSPWLLNFVSTANNLLKPDDLRTYFSNFQDFGEYLSVAEDKRMFNSLIAQRTDYLSTLPALRAGWISGDSSAPSEEVCSAAISFLQDFEKFIFSRHAKPVIPNLVLGPIPTGGVGVELSNGDSGLYVFLHNDRHVEIDTERNGEFASEEITLDQFREDFVSYFQRFLA